MSCSQHTTQSQARLGSVITKVVQLRSEAAQNRLLQTLIANEPQIKFSYYGSGLILWCYGQNITPWVGYLALAAIGDISFNAHVVDSRDEELVILGTGAGAHIL